jgi:hypothetical protein
MYLSVRGKIEDEYCKRLAETITALYQVSADDSR